MRFCSQCGKPISDAAKFCGSCGATVAAPAPTPGASAAQPAQFAQPAVPPRPSIPQPSMPSRPVVPPQSTQPAAFQPPVPQPAVAPPSGANAALAAAMPARHTKRIVAIIAAIVAVAVGGTLAWAIPNVPAVRQMLGIGPKNPVAITAQVLQSAQNINSARFELTYGENYKDQGERTVTFKGKYALGANTDASLLDVQEEDGGYTGRAVWSGGAVGVQNKNNDQYGYIDVNGLRDDLQDLLEYDLDSTTAKQYTDLAFNVKDAIIRNGKVDGEGALKVFNDGMSSLNDEYAQEYRKYVPNDAANKQYGEFLTAFVTKELERDDVQARVFPGKTESNGADGTTLRFGLNLAELVHVLAEYWSANQNSYPDLRKTLVDSFSSSSDPEASYNDAIQQLRDWQNNDESLNNLKVSLTYGLGYELKELDLSDTVVHWNLKLSDLNKVSPNDPDAAQFMSEAKAKNSMFSF